MSDGTMTTRVGDMRPAREVPAEDEQTFWMDRSRIALTPIAAPSVLGLFGFAGATLIVAAHLAGWYGSTTSNLYLFPFAAFFGGLAQFLAGMWAYKARDALATAMHGTWGAFWLAFGVLNILFATGTLTDPGTKFPELGFWFIALAAVTLMGTFAALSENLGLVAVLGTLTAGSVLAAIAYLAGSSATLHAAGWVLVFSAGFAWYTAGAMMLESSFRRVILPLGKYSRRGNLPGARLREPIEYAAGSPGVKIGQ